MALREFLGKRGTAWSIRSNNGKNFIEASKEAQKGLQVMNHDQINISRKLEQIGLSGENIHLVHDIWEAFGSIKLEQLEILLMLTGDTWTQAEQWDIKNINNRNRSHHQFLSTDCRDSQWC